MKKLMEKRFEIFHKITNNLLLITFLGGILTVFLTGAVYVYKGVQEQLDDYADAVMNVISIDEDQYVMCTTMTGTHPLFQANTIFTLHNESRIATDQLIKKLSELEVYISYEDYYSVVELICWNNYLLKAGMQLCKMDLKSVDMLDNLRRQIMQKIIKDKETHQQWGFILFKDYFNFIKSFFLPRRASFEQAYHRPANCNKQK